MANPQNAPAVDPVDAIRARHAAATRGPWKWFGYHGSHQIELCARDTIMSFRRWGMRSAQPLFCTDGLLYGVKTLAVPDSAPERRRITDINHPDARFMAAAWQDVADLLAEVDRLRGLVKSDDKAEN